MALSRNMRAMMRHNADILRRQPLAELSGSLGDLGTLLPLLVALTLTHSISLPTTLVFTGAFNILTGLAFGIPLPVQPMKAIAAVAIANNYNVKETSAAGILVSAAVGVLAVTGLLRWVNRVVPVPVVKGIQVGAGLSLILSGGSSLLGKLGWTHPGWSDNYIWALFAFFFLLYSSHVPRVPYALVIFVIGLILGSIHLSVDHVHKHTPAFHIWHPRTYVPSGKNFLNPGLPAALGQLPLTTLNSIIAVTHLSADLLPEVPTPTVTAIGLSVAAMNLISCWFGGMPACHGSGGLAGQYRFGARSGASIIILGLVKVILGLFVGEGLVGLLNSFPKSLLGIMVIAAGVELAKVGESLNVGARDLWEEAGHEDDSGRLLGEGRKIPKNLTEQERRDRWAVMMVTVAGLLAFRNDAVGFLAGMSWHWGIQAQVYWEKRQKKRMGSSEEAERLLGRNSDAPEGRLA